MVPKNPYVYLIAAVFLVTVGFWAYNYGELQSQYETAKTGYDQALRSLGNSSAQQGAIQESNQELLAKVGALQKEGERLQISYKAKDAECRQFQDNLDKCISSNAQSNRKIDELESNVLFKGGNVTVNFYLNDSFRHYFVYNVSILNYYLNEGYLNRRIMSLYQDGFPASSLSVYFEQFRLNRFMYDGTPQPTIAVENAEGKTVRVRNYPAFKDTKGISSLANYVKAASASDLDFIRNVIRVKSQLNDYTYDIRGEPRYPLETFLEGGGDCGASSLLIGSMIKAAHPEWKVQMLLVDADPTSPPVLFNHFILYVENGPGMHVYVETTLKDPDEAMSIYDGKQIYGKSFDF